MSQKRKRSAGNDAASNASFPPSSRSSALVPPATKILVHNLYEDKCWLCTSSGDDVAHVYPQSEEGIFQIYKSSNMISSQTIHSSTNLLLLCPSCHRSFDRPFPAWIFLPSPPFLNQLIQDEEAFQSRRATAAQRGVRLIRKPRALKDPRTKSGRHGEGEEFLYTRYMLREDYFRWSKELFVVMRERHWGGDPACVVMRGAGWLCLPGAGEVVGKEVREGFIKLIGLWGAREPGVVGGVGRVVVDGGDDEEEEVEEEDNGDGSQGDMYGQEDFGEDDMDELGMDMPPPPRPTGLRSPEQRRSVAMEKGRSLRSKATARAITRGSHPRLRRQPPHLTSPKKKRKLAPTKSPPRRSARLAAPPPSSPTLPITPDTSGPDTHTPTPPGTRAKPKLPTPRPSSHKKPSKRKSKSDGEERVDGHPLSDHDPKEIEEPHIFGPEWTSEAFRELWESTEVMREEGRRHWKIMEGILRKAGKDEGAGGDEEG